MKNFLFLTLLILVSTSASWAEEAAPEVVEKKPIFYFDLTPPVIVNYQKPGARKMGFVNFDIQFVVSSEDALDLLETHKPLLEDAIVDVMNGYDEATIKDVSKRVGIRSQLKTRLSKVLLDETGQEIIDDVLFTKFVYQ